MSEGLQTSQVICNPIVMVISNKNLVQLLDDVFGLHQAHLAYSLVNLLQLLADLLLTGLPLNSESPVPAFGTVMCESQEIKGLRLCSSLRTVITGETTELKQPALFFLET